MFSKWMYESEKDEWKNDFYDNSVMTTHQWTMVMLLMMFPVVNIIMIIRWAFADKELTNANQVNWARAIVIILVYSLITLAFLAGILFLAWYIQNYNY